MPLTPAAKQRRYRERRKNNPEKEAQNKIKDRKRYHVNKRLVRDLTAREHRSIKRNGDRPMLDGEIKSEHSVLLCTLQSHHSLVQIVQLTQINTQVKLRGYRHLSTPQLSTSRESTSNSTPATARGRKQVKRNRSKLFRNNMKLKEQFEPVKKTYEKYRKRYNREKRKRFQNKDGSQTNQQKYEILSNAINKRYKNVKTRKEKDTILKIFQEETVKRSRQKTQMIKECLSVDFCQKRSTGFYRVVYSSDSDDDAPLMSLKEKPSTTYTVEQPCTSKENENALIEKENIHVNKIKQGVCVLMKVSSSKQDYVYLGKALSEVEEDGEVKIMFFKTIDHSATKFKLVETDLSYEPFDNLLAIFPEPKKFCKGKRDRSPLDIFEK